MQRTKKKESIRVKYLRVTLSALLLLSLAMGFTSIFVVNRLAQTDAEHLMTQICAEETMRFDSKLNLVKHSVDMIYEYIYELNSNNKSDIFSENQLESVKDFAVSIANKTDGAMAVYYRFNPDMIGDGTSGFFWSRKQADANFVAETPTDILAYNSTDMEHVGWFYVPKESGKTLWMAPYYNQNLDVFMISYIIPVYLEKGEFLGVVGMDIDFNTVMNVAGSVQLYQTGKLALVDLSERLIYYSDANGNAKGEKISNKLYNHVTTINKDSELLQITEENGKGSVICCERLSNGMVLYVNVPVDEIYENRDQLVAFLVGLTVLISAMAIAAVRKSTMQIIRPINKLVEVTGKYANGDWSENYICDSGDEIQELSESIAVMAGKTQEYIATVNSFARIDTLTGLNNKNSYIEWIEAVKSNKDNKYREYALVVMDLNLLKKTNDNYGHEAGDALLYEAGQYISRIFGASASFRMGGDEFVAILYGENYSKRYELIERFEREMDYEVKNAFGMHLSISFGMSECPNEGVDFDELFKIADERMYIKKKQMKMERKD